MILGEIFRYWEWVVSVLEAMTGITKWWRGREGSRWRGRGGLASDGGEAKSADWGTTVEAGEGDCERTIKVRGRRL